MSFLCHPAIFRANEQIERRIAAGKNRDIEAKNQLIFDRWQLRNPVGRTERALYKEQRVSRTCFGWYFYEGSAVPEILKEFKERLVTREIYLKEVLKR